MQVGQAVQDTPYAAIGGKKAEAFKIGVSGHAFKILSSGLYRDKIRAAVREILCNAVDAHIASGIADKPVEVTLTDKELVIRDFGKGIPDDKIVDIYATYFGSSKSDDDTQTGGFGLGSKAPFAYTDHFTVTSCCNGTKTVYALTIGAVETGGAPACRQMVQVPTSDIGVIVSIPIHATDKSAFDQAVRNVAFEGGMKVQFNGAVLPTIDFALLQSTGFMFVAIDEIAGDTYLRTASARDRIRVVYANVAYPLDNDDRLKDVMSRFVSMMPQRHAMYLYVPPSSVSVTPSRESLSYDEKTVEVLSSSFKRIGANITAKLKIATAIVADELLTWTKGNRLNFGQKTTMISHIGTNLQASIAKRPEVSKDLLLLHLTKFVAGTINPLRDDFMVLVAEAAMRRFHAHKRSIRLAMEAGVRWGSRMGRTTYISDKLARENKLAQARALIRVANKFEDIIDGYGARDGRSLRSVKGIGRVYYNTDLCVVLHDDAENIRNMGCDGASYIRLKKNADATRVGELKDYLNKFGFVPDEAVPKIAMMPKPMKIKETPPPEKFAKIAFTSSGYVGAAETMAPVAYMNLGVQDNGGRKDDAFYFNGDMVRDREFMKRFAKVFPGDIQAPHNQKQQAALDKAGVPSIEKKALELIRERAKKMTERERSYVMLNFLIVSSENWETLHRSIFGFLVGRPRDFYHHCMGYEFKPDPVMDEAFDFWIVMRRVFNYSRMSAWFKTDDVKTIHALRDEFKEECRKILAKGRSPIMKLLSVPLDDAGKTKIIDILNKDLAALYWLGTITSHYIITTMKSDELRGLLQWRRRYMEQESRAQAKASTAKTKRVKPASNAATSASPADASSDGAIESTLKAMFMPQMSSGLDDAAQSASDDKLADAEI